MERPDSESAVPATGPIYGASFVHVAEPGRSIKGVVRERANGQAYRGGRRQHADRPMQGQFQIDGLTPEFNIARR